MNIIYSAWPPNTSGQSYIVDNYELKRFKWQNLPKSE